MTWNQLNITLCRLLLGIVGSLNKRLPMPIAIVTRIVRRKGGTKEFKIEWLNEFNLGVKLICCRILGFES